MSAPAALLAGLIAEAARRFAAHDSVIARDLAAALATAPVAPVAPVAPLSPAPTPHPATAALDALSHAGGDALMRRFAEAAPTLGWRSPGFGRLTGPARDRIAVAEILGPTGMIPHRRIRFGALVQGADLRYPDHSHAAEELYLVVAGRARWSMDGGGAAAKAPGAFIHHPPSRPHMMETGATPMLALWGWTGEIGGDSYQVGR